MAANAPGSVVNTATVSGGGNVNSGNNTANDTTTILAVTPTPALSPFGQALFVFVVFSSGLILLRRRLPLGG